MPSMQYESTGSCDRRVLLCLLVIVTIVSVIAFAAPVAMAQAANESTLFSPMTGDEGRDVYDPVNEFVGGWEDVLDWKKVAVFAGSLLLAVGLAATIAFHPLTFGRASSPEELEAPKTYLVYALVGAVCGRAVMIYPQIGLVIFGLGGLMRFRTDVGAAKDTGRVILVTVVGLCCGMDAFVVAIVTTVFGYVLVFLLERNVVYRVVVKGVLDGKLYDVEQAYAEVLDEYGCRVVNQKKRLKRKQIVIVFRAPARLDRDDIELILDEDVPTDLKGSVDWQTK